MTFLDSNANPSTDSLDSSSSNEKFKYTFPRGTELKILFNSDDSEKSVYQADELVYFYKDNQKKHSGWYYVGRNNENTVFPLHSSRCRPTGNHRIVKNAKFANKRKSSTLDYKSFDSISTSSGALSRQTRSKTIGHCRPVSMLGGIPTPNPRKNDDYAVKIEHKHMHNISSYQTPPIPKPRTKATPPKPPPSNLKSPMTKLKPETSLDNSFESNRSRHFSSCSISDSDAKSVKSHAGYDFLPPQNASPERPKDIIKIKFKPIRSIKGEVIKKPSWFSYNILLAMQFHNTSFGNHSNKVVRIPNLLFYDPKLTKKQINAIKDKNAENEKRLNPNFAFLLNRCKIYWLHDKETKEYDFKSSKKHVIVIWRAADDCKRNAKIALSFDKRKDAEKWFNELTAEMTNYDNVHYGQRTQIKKVSF